ncbi:hypothetical protein NP233_g11487 [Leucocoprinus birnbaumii]|uniref:Uncharacterized protein n=1 Tax=Leucocoprinus birnbaumii TaxID=56174 RepID=A0AAD5YKD7_9AGAR|nr:hypothetical protein NP233_g11487 [Leucocoprinus birnbaumii]
MSLFLALASTRSVDSMGGTSTLSSPDSPLSSPTLMDISDSPSSPSARATSVVGSEREVSEIISIPSDSEDSGGEYEAIPVDVYMKSGSQHSVSAAKKGKSRDLGKPMIILKTRSPPKTRSTTARAGARNKAQVTASTSPVIPPRRSPRFKRVPSSELPPPEFSNASLSAGATLSSASTAGTVDNPIKVGNIFQNGQTPLSRARERGKGKASVSTTASNVSAAGSSTKTKAGPSINLISAVRAIASDQAAASTSTSAAQVKRQRWYTVTRGSSLGVYSDLNFAVACAGPEDGKIDIFTLKGDAAIRFLDCYSRDDLEQFHGDNAMEKEKDKFKRVYQPLDDDDDSTPDNFGPIQLEPEDLLGGGVPLDISHAGGELLDILHLADEDISRPRYMDGRTRRDHVENRNQAFKQQMPSIVEAYLAWDAGLGDVGLEGAQPEASDPNSSGIRLQVFDVFRSRIIQTDVVDGPEGIVALLVKRGLVPCAPLCPSIAVTTRLLELYRNVHLRCPHLSIHAFIQSLCDLHGIPFRPYLSTQFSICYDLYSDIRAEVQLRVNQALGRGASDWQLRNACPACTYKLEGEPPLVHELLFTMDGNDSLKRVIRKDTYEDLDDPNRDQAPILISKEAMDSQRVPGDYYLEREMVDRWAKDHVMEALREGGIDADNPCASRWSNIVNEVSARMWGVFDEMGIFLSLCRHGFGLVVADMAQSGELAKYPLAVVEALLNAFGPKLGGGYDIGCRFGKTLAESALGERAHELQYTSLVGAFHGHAHNRLCQLSHLATYVEGMGLEDLEGCERFFSKSNALASSVRYASVFHRRQRIAQFIQHMDVAETSQKLSEFLVNNYKQALKIIDGEEELRRAMQDAHINSTTIFHEWLKEEKSYLDGLRKEPPVEKLQIDYYEELIKLSICKDEINELARESFIPFEWPSSADSPEVSTGVGSSVPQKRKHLPQQRLGLQKLHANERLASTEAKVHNFEELLGVTTRWEPNTPEWDMVKTLADHRRYQRCLDKLESLVVSRFFELSKMNMAGTGYKLRKHIRNALRQRSQAIRNAIDEYNAAAAELKPPHFTLLRDCREDVTQRIWARPTSRRLMDQYFKTVRAREEIVRLNVEIRRVITHMHDEEQFLRAKEAALAPKDAYLAHQIKKLRLERTRFNEIHARRFAKLKKVSGFTGCLALGRSLDRSRHQAATESGSESIAPEPLEVIVESEDEEDIEELVAAEEDEQLRLIDERLEALSLLLQNDS